MNKDKRKAILTTLEHTTTMVKGAERRLIEIENQIKDEVGDTIIRCDLEIAGYWIERALHILAESEEPT